VAHTVDEELLAFRKEDRQGVEEVRHVQPVRMPGSEIAILEAEAQIAAWNLDGVASGIGRGAHRLLLQVMLHHLVSH
jgi:hypothetical protein